MFIVTDGSQECTVERENGGEQGIYVLPDPKDTELGIIPSESSPLRVLRWTALGKTISWQQPRRERKVERVEGRTQTLQN